MPSDEAATALVADHGEEGYLFPSHGPYSFQHVAPTALSVLDATPPGTQTLPTDVFGDRSLAGIDHVVVLLVDGLGYDVWQQAATEVPFVANVDGAGTVTPLSTVYPSETAAAIPTLHTGVSPAAHGILGWHQYVERVRTAVQVLPWTTQAGDPVPGPVDSPSAWREVMLGAEPLYSQVDLATRVLQPADVADSLSGIALTAGVDARLGYHNAPDAAVGLRHALERADGLSYTLVYLPDVDTIAHRDGPESEGSRAQIDAIGAAFQRELVQRLAPALAARTLLVVTADHGQVDTRGENVDIRGYGPIWDNLAVGADDEPIPPVGSSRNLHLFLADGTAEPVRDALERDFDCRAFTRSEYEERRLFGPDDACDQYRRRAPDVVCVHRERGMWYDDDSLATVGRHGGLTRAEMIVPFAVARLDELKPTTVD